MSAPAVLVAGSGRAAVEAAREVVAQGGRAILVRSGGAMRQCALRVPGGFEIIEAELVGVEGAPGRFSAVLRVSGGDDITVECSSVILAPGPEDRPAANGAVALDDLDVPSVGEIGSAAFVLPDGSPRPSFIRAVRAAMELRARASRPSVTVFAEEMSAYGTDEAAYRQAQAGGVLFVRTSDAEISIDPLRVMATDRTTGHEVAVTPDLLVVGKKLPAGDEIRASPGSFAVAIGVPGMGVASTVCEGIVTSGREDERLDGEAITGARAAATRAMTVALFPADRASQAVIVDRDRCAACLTCARICPFGAAHPSEEGKASIDGALCQACGICVGACPGRALSLPGPGGVAEGEEMLMGERQ